MGVQDTPNINVIITVQIENKIWKSTQLSAAQARQVQFMSISRRTGSRANRYEAIRLPDCIDETKGHVDARLLGVIVYRFLNVRSRLFTRDNRLGIHLEARLRARPCKPSKYASSTGSVGALDAPSRRRRRKYCRS